MGSRENQRIAKSHPNLARGCVWCIACKRSHPVDAATALASGWPKCCGYTMTIDSPSEREVQHG